MIEAEISLLRIVAINLSNFNKNNAFDVEKYLAHRLVMSKDTEFEMYEVTVTQEDVSAIGSTPFPFIQTFLYPYQ